MPRPRQRGSRDADLEQVTLLLPCTVKNQDKALEGFRRWLRAFGISVELDQLVKCRQLVGDLSRAYGRHLFKDGAPLFSFLMYLTALDRLDKRVRPSLDPAWEIARKWRALEPGCHRTPIAFPLFKAMIVVALLMKWTRMAGCMAISFLGPGRIGEVLRASRAELVLPSDLLFEPSDRVFLQVSAPKSAHSGGALTQHITVRDHKIAAFLSAVFCDLRHDERLFPFSPSAFRTRWNFVLGLLRIPPAAGYTPGGLRGGGAVHAYLHDVHPSDIQWRMRLKHMTTLQHYLQEVTCLMSLRQLSSDARENVRLCASFFDILVCLLGSPRTSA